MFVVLGLLVSSMSYADEFGGWKFTAPSGAKKETLSTAVSFTKIDNAAKTFCKIGLYAARAPAGDDVNAEWEALVAKSYTVVNATEPQSFKLKNMPLSARTATLKIGGETFAAAFYVLQPPGAVAGLILLSSNETSIAKCPIRPFLDSLSLVKAPAATAPAAPAAEPAAAAGGPAIAGTWSTGSSVYDGRGVSMGSINRKYDFKPDGTYTYFRETWGGYTRSTWYFTVLETGTWKLAGDRLTVTPKTVVGTEYDTGKNTKKAVKVPVEPATYTVKTVYMSGLDMWNLVMTIDKPTQRDGAFSSNSTYPRSYLLDQRNNAVYKFPPK